MDFRFGAVHLDPASDPPELHLLAFDLFCELWGRLNAFREPSGEDQLILHLIDHAQRELLVVAMVLREKDAGVAPRRPDRDPPLKFRPRP